jgi:hypothetical protein
MRCDNQPEDDIMYAPKTKMEKRAAEFATENLDGATIAVIWNKNRTWGTVPVIKNWSGEVVARASGCGYDKLSAVLTDLLMFLPVENNEEIARCSNAGFSSLARALENQGWNIQQTYCGRTEDAFKLTRI